MLCNILFELEIFKVSNVTRWLIFRNPVTYSLVLFIAGHSIVLRKLCVLVLQLLRLEVAWDISVKFGASGETEKVCVGE